MLDISEKNVRKNMVLSTVYRALSMVISYLYVPVVFAMLVTPYWSRTSVAKSHDDYNLIKKEFVRCNVCGEWALLVY